MYVEGRILRSVTMSRDTHLFGERVAGSDEKEKREKGKEFLPMPRQIMAFAHPC